MDDDRDDRPDPDALLANVKAEETRAAQGRLNTKDRKEVR